MFKIPTPVTFSNFLSAFWNPVRFNSYTNYISQNISHAGEPTIPDSCSVSLVPYHVFRSVTSNAI